jgi:type 1 fimbria pilin
MISNILAAFAGRFSRSGWRAVVVAIAVCMGATAAGAQISGTGSVQGTVTDTTGAVVGGANVTLTNDATQVKRTATTDKQGLYSFSRI